MMQESHTIITLRMSEDKYLSSAQKTMAQLSMIYKPPTAVHPQCAQRTVRGCVRQSFTRRFKMDDIICALPTKRPAMMQA